MRVEEVVGPLKAHEEKLKGTSKSGGGQLLLTSQNLRARGGSFRDKSRMKCYNCKILAHYVVECSKLRQEREKREEENLAQIEDDEPLLL